MKHFLITLLILCLSCQRDEMFFFYSPTRQFKLVRWDSGKYTSFIILKAGEKIDRKYFLNNCFLVKKETDFREDWVIFGRWQEACFNFYYHDNPLNFIKRNSCDNLKYVEIPAYEFRSIYNDPKGYIIFKQKD
jgi:hypothetical protein